MSKPCMVPPHWKELSMDGSEERQSGSMGGKEFVATLPKGAL